MNHPAKLYNFFEKNGYILPKSGKGSQDLLAIRHSAMVTSWTDSDVHIHTTAEEYYLLLHGQLWFLVGDGLIDLRPYEILMVKPQTPHAILRGQGPIEHIGLRAPAIDDRQSRAGIPANPPSAGLDRLRQMEEWWGFRVPLTVAENQNCWLFGSGSARFESCHLSLAYLDFQNQQAATAGIGTRHRLHLHQRAWEYYTVILGTKTLQIEDRLQRIHSGQILELPPGIVHGLRNRTAPYRGLTLRVPIALNDKIEFE